MAMFTDSNKPAFYELVADTQQSLQMSDRPYVPPTDRKGNHCSVIGRAHKAIKPGVTAQKPTPAQILRV